MANADLYKGFSAEKQAGYEAWLVERRGEPMRTGIEHSKRAFAKMSAAERNAFLETQGRELREVESALAGALRQGVDPAADAVDLLIRRHRAWVAAMWARPCPAEAYAGLADLYLEHPDFVTRYERIETGFARYLAGAMKIHAQRWRESAG